MRISKNSVIVERILTENLLKSCAPLLVEAYNAKPWNDNWSEERALKKIRYAFEAPRFLGFAAEKNGQYLGCLVGNIEPNDQEDYFYLRDMFVAESQRHLGIGSLLLKNLKVELEKIGIKSILLFTSSKYQTSDFYIKNGFKFLDGMCLMYID